MYSVARMMKKGLKIGLIVIILLLSLGFFTYKIIDNNLRNLLVEDIKNINMNDINDGKYIGAYAVFPISVELIVTVQNHEIIEIEITKHENGQGKAAETIINSVIKFNSIEVDVVSGASYSSQSILHAISNALNQK